MALGVVGARLRAVHCVACWVVSRLKRQLDKVLTHDDPAERVMYWSYDEFAPIAQAIDRLMEARGWARRKKTPRT